MFSKIKKFIPYTLILIVLVGFFSFHTNKAEAADVCVNVFKKPLTNIKDKTTCESSSTRGIYGGTTWVENWVPPASDANRPKCTGYNDYTKSPTPSDCVGTEGQVIGNLKWSEGRWIQATPQEQQEQKQKQDTSSALAKFLSNECGITSLNGLSACLLGVIYWIFNGVGSFLLWVAGYFFNAIIAITLLDSSLYGAQPFLTEAWVVVRDLSNIFFIIALLYIALQTILDLGHGAPKKAIANIVIMALLINFSMFFTKVVIDSSNILALVFYNKLAVETKITRTDGSKVDRDYTKATGKLNEKDLSGAMMAAFNPTKLLSAEFLQKAKSVPTMGDTVNEDVPFTMLLALIILSGIIMAFGAYAFFIAGASFLGRMIELWVLIIFSPFAFMSSSVSFLEGIPTIGWKAWLSRLLSASFMAPIFMFFMYFIFKLIAANPFSGMINAKDDSVGIIGTILLVIIPSLVILSLLMKATEYAKKGSGQFGEMALGAVKGIAALTAGGAILTAATAGKQTVGRFMKGASTGDTWANRVRDERNSGHIDPGLNRFSRFIGRNIEGTTFHQFQETVGRRLRDDKGETTHAAHARHELDTMASSITHGHKKKWDELDGDERYQARRQLARDRLVRDNAGDVANNGASLLAAQGVLHRFGNKKWEALTTIERDAVDAQIGAGAHGAVAGTPLGNGTTVADEFIRDARAKQNLRSVLMQSTVTGSYDARNLANVIMKEQSTGFAKIAMGLTGALAMGMRGGFKSIGINTGKAQGAFFKDLGTIISESLKSVKLNVDLSHVGDEHKGDDHGGGHGGGHH